MRKIRTYNQVESQTGDLLVEQIRGQRARLASRLAGVRNLIAVGSGKGGVGKSLVTANLAAALAEAGQRVGALDADLNGPSLARMLGASGGQLVDGAEGVAPVRAACGVRVMSMELLQNDPDAPLRWRAPSGSGFVWQSSIETGTMREFLSDVAWGELDFLLMDLPPGTDKMTRLFDLLPGLQTMLLVTTPSEMSRRVVARAARLAREQGIPEVGLVANMTEYVCPCCGHTGPLFPGDGVARLADATGLEVWARIPFDPRLGETSDRGVPVVVAGEDSPPGRAFRALAGRLTDIGEPQTERDR
jgi:ATP-binding protein involved in chromosome partitioning